MVLRCTARLLALLGGRDLHVAEGPPADDDWYANLPNHRALGPYVTGLVVDALADEGLAADTLGRLDPGDVRVARTASRSVLGHMNDMAFMCRQEVETAGGLAQTDFDGVNHRLRRGLQNRGGYVVPLELAASRAGRDLT